MQYPAIITKEGDFTLAEFPDCPGCQTFSRNPDRIEAMAEEAIEGWLESHLGRDLIPPRPGVRRVPSSAKVIQVRVPLQLAFRLGLRWARAELGATQDELARALGMSQQQLAKLERPGANPTLSTLEKLAQLPAFEVDLSVGPAKRSTSTARKGKKVLARA